MVQNSKTGGEREGLECCKVGRTATTFDVLLVVDKLADRRRDGDSFRDLASYFNTRVVERALERADVEDGRSVHAALVGDDLPRSVYRVLHGDSDSDIRRTELRARLADAGVDVDTLEAAFVSHVTLRSHLKECAGVEKEQSPPPFEYTVNTTQWARTRASNIVQNALDRAVRIDQLQTGSLEADVTVHVTCADCGDTFYLSELLDQRRCSCRGDDSSDT